jgi:hypothetical protein
MICRIKTRSQIESDREPVMGTIFVPKTEKVAGG